MENIEKEIEKISISLMALPSFEYCRLASGMNMFDSVILDIGFQNMSMRIINSRNEFMTYLCPKNLTVYTYTLNEILLVLKIAMPTKTADFGVYVSEVVNIYLNNLDSIQELFKVEKDKPTVDQYVFWSDRRAIWNA